MASLFVPTPASRALPVIFNVDGVVGAFPAENKREDVLLVHFALAVIAKFPFPETPPAIISAAKAVKVTGVIDDATIVAIRTYQQDYKREKPGTIVDGRVSPARGSYRYGTGLWTISYLNRSMQQRNVGIWPRIDRIAGCPTELQQMVTRTVTGTP